MHLSKRSVPAKRWPRIDVDFNAASPDRRVALPLTGGPQTRAKELFRRPTRRVCVVDKAECAFLDRLEERDRAERRGAALIRENDAASELYADPARGDSFVPGLTQEEIGDATGLTAVHVNRMLRQLEDERLIARSNGRIRFLDEARLARAANYVDRMVGLDLSWLPATA